MVIMDFVVVALLALALIIIEVPVFIASMFGLTRLDPETTFPDFSFTELSKPKLTKLVEQLILFLGLAIVPLHIIAYGVRQALPNTTPYIALVALLLIGLQAAAFYVTATMLLALDPKKSAILAAANTAFYVVLYVSFIHYNLH